MEEGRPTSESHMPGPQPQHQVPAVGMKSADVLWLPGEYGYPSLQLAGGGGEPCVPIWEGDSSLGRDGAGLGSSTTDSHCS